MGWISIPVGIAAFVVGLAASSFGTVSEAEFAAYARQRSDKMQQCIDGLTRAVVYIETLKAEAR